jgi:hypothetical protein
MHGIHQHRKGAFFPQAAGLAQAENAFHEAVAFFRSCAEAAFTPRNGKAQGRSARLIAAVRVQF